MFDLPEKALAWKDARGWETVRFQTNEEFPEIGLVTLNRPQNLNALNDALMDDLDACLDVLAQAFDCRVVILAGAGRHFCAGADLTTSLTAEQSYDWANFPDRVKVFWQKQQKLSTLVLKLRRIPQPVVAAVHGAAVGGGMAFTNASDIVIAAKGSRFLNAFVKIGLGGADCGSSYFLPRIVGFHRSAELLYSGRDLPAEEAHRWGYVNFLVEKDEEVVPYAVRFVADQMLTRSPMGLRLTKEALNYNIDAGGAEAAIRVEDRNQTLCAQTEDAWEGIAAFFEKRRAKYGPR